MRHTKSLGMQKLVQWKANHVLSTTLATSGHVRTCSGFLRGKWLVSDLNQSPSSIIHIKSLGIQKLVQWKPNQVPRTTLATSDHVRTCSGYFRGSAQFLTKTHHATPLIIRNLKTRSMKAKLRARTILIPEIQIE